MARIRGKKDRFVSVLLTKDMTHGIDTLLSARETYVPQANPYLFAPVGNENNYIHGWTALKTVVTAVGSSLKNAAAINSTKLRKYVATVSQVRNRMRWNLS